MAAASTSAITSSSRIRLRCWCPPLRLRTTPLRRPALLACLSVGLLTACGPIPLIAIGVAAGSGALGGRNHSEGGGGGPVGGPPGPPVPPPAPPPPSPPPPMRLVFTAQPAASVAGASLSVKRPGDRLGPVVYRVRGAQSGDRPEVPGIAFPELVGA